MVQQWLRTSRDVVRRLGVQGGRAAKHAGNANSVRPASDCLTSHLRVAARAPADAAATAGDETEYQEPREGISNMNVESICTF